MTTTLTHQHETTADDQARTFGYEVFHDPDEGFYTARLHIRTYDGIKVDSSWTSGEVRLDATSAGAANREAAQMLAGLRACLEPAASEPRPCSER